MVKVAINNCWGGFGVSQAVYRFLIDKKNWQISKETDNPKEKIIYWDERNHEYFCSFYDLDRANPDLIEAIETIGLKESNDRYSEIQIFEIPNNTKWYISNYDGMETIHEVHQTWG